MAEQTSFLGHEAENGRIESTSSIALSISTLAREFSVSRETARAWLDSVGAQITGYKNGYPLFALRDCITGFRANTPPDLLPPAQRLAHYKALEVMDAVALKRGNLVTRDDHREELGRILKIVAQELESLTDEIERDVGASTLVLAKIDEKIDLIRQRIAERIVEQPELVTPAAK
jgi:hypothetical protein